MSGGSYDYLCWKSAEELFEYRQQLASMGDRLAGINTPDAQAASRETYDVLAILNSAEAQITARIKRLSDVWHAVEWLDDGDYSEKQMHDALHLYGFKPDEPPTP